MHKNVAWQWGLICLLQGCIPRFEKSYPAPEAAPLALGEALGPTLAPPSPSQGAKVALIYPINKQTFIFPLAEQEVWNAAIDVLMKNYNLMILDKQNGVITTEWDSFYLEEEVFRNKVSLRIVGQGYRLTQVTIINNVEALWEGTGSNSRKGSGVWLPASDQAGESARIIKSLAAVLHYPPPEIPPEMLANQSRAKATASF